MTLPETLGQWPISVEIPVAWGDMDALGHVNNVTYLRWFETGRIAHFSRLLAMPGIPTAGVGPILARQAIDYKMQLAYPDLVRVETTISRLGRTSLTMSFRIASKAKSWAIAAEGEGVLVLFDYAKNEKVPIDDPMRQAIYRLELNKDAPG